jgi:hypothetical protein
LEEKGHTYNAESEKHDQIPLGEKSGEGKSGGEGNNSSQSCPSGDECQAEAGPRLTLVKKTAPNKPRDAR